MRDGNIAGRRQGKAVDSCVRLSRTAREWMQLSERNEVVNLTWRRWLSGALLSLGLCGVWTLTSGGSGTAQDQPAGDRPRPEEGGASGERGPGNRPPGERPPGDRGPNDRGRGPDASIDRLMQADKNKDGALTAEEVNDERLNALLKRADADADGKVTRAELVALMQKEQGDRPRGPGGPEGRGPQDRGPGDRGPGFGPEGRGPQDRGPGDRGPGERGPQDRGPGFGPEGRGPGGPGFGPGGDRPMPPRPGTVLPPFLQDQLRLTEDQRAQLHDLQKDVDARLSKILTEEQREQMKRMGERRPGFGGPGGPEGRGPGGDRGPGFGPGGDRGPGGERGPGREGPGGRRPPEGGDRPGGDREERPRRPAAEE